MISLCSSFIFGFFFVFSLPVPGGYVSGGEAPRIIREAILLLCQQLKPDAVSLVDAIAPPDFILNSPIGASDGQVRSALHHPWFTTFIICYKKLLVSLLCYYCK